MTFEVHAISTGKQSIDEFVTITKEIEPFVDYIHIRERRWTAHEHVQAIDQLIASGFPLEKIIVNDRLDVALVMDVGGVQLAGRSVSIERVRDKFPTLKIGCSVHSLKEAEEKANAGANYIIYGHIYETNSKKGLKPRGVEALSKMTKSVSIPVIAIGGITPERALEVTKAGASGVAVLSYIFLAANPYENAKQLATTLKGGV